MAYEQIIINILLVITFCIFLIGLTIIHADFIKYTKYSEDTYTKLDNTINKNNLNVLKNSIFATMCVLVFGIILGIIKYFTI